MCSTTASKSGASPVPLAPGSVTAHPSRPAAYRNGASSCASSASRSISSSSTSSWISPGRASVRSILFTTTTGSNPSASALRVTKRVCGIGPSAASTRSSTPSTMRRIRSTSPPKSACPGVSTMLILVPRHSTAVFLERMVMPRSRSSGLESRTRSPTTCPSRKIPAWRNIWSTSVVLPWSTWAMIAMLRRGFTAYPPAPSVRVKVSVATGARENGAIPRRL